MDKFNQLLEVADTADQAELKILHNSQIKCARAYNDDPTSTRKRDWDAAKRGLEEAIKFFTEKYNIGESVVFNNRLEVIEHLRSQGYKIGKTKFYEDCKQKKVRIQADGSILAKDAELYAVREGIYRPEAISSSNKAEGLHETKLQKEIEKLTWENKKREFEYDLQLGKYIPRDLLDLELASRAAVFDSQLRTKIKARIKTWIAMADGKIDKQPDIAADAFEMLDQVMNEFARMDRFEVVFGDPSEPGTEQ